MLADFSLAGKVAIVTGALGLIGRHYICALSQAGAKVVVADLDEERCQAEAALLPGPSLGVGVDITEPDAVHGLVDRTLERFGRVDVLVNNAALNEKVEDPMLALEQSRFENYGLEQWQRMLDVNVTGTFLCCQVVGSLLAGQGSGSIINIASTYGLVAPDQSLYRTPEGEQMFFKSPAYSTTKAAVIGLTKYLAAYWGEAGVRVNALCPGGVQNGQAAWFVENYARRTPLQRMARPDDYGGALVFLASDASRYMTGASLVVDGGWTVW